jgi:predicted RNase H-like nuclease (RuvC/YqgF family)
MSSSSKIFINHSQFLRDMLRLPIIVGIDPGTTLGFAVIDTTGAVVKVGSAKELSLSTLIHILTDYGRIVAVGCDKSNVPSFVERFATKTGSKVIAPKTDLMVSEKRELAGPTKVQDSHQMDALASAFFALRKLKALIRKVRLVVKKEKKEDIHFKILDLVIRKGCWDKVCDRCN